MENKLHGKLTWSDFNPVDIRSNKKNDRIIGLTFPISDKKLGLEPSVLSVLPDGDNVEYSCENRIFNDKDVKYYVCSVYISGYEEFIKWSLQHDNKKIIVGGYHPTTFPNDFIKYAAKIVQGPCDDFYATIEQVGQIVSGIVTHKHIPRRDLYDLRINQQIIPDKMPDDMVASINTSMGCANNPPCDFCASPIMCSKVMSRPIEIIEKELYDIEHQAIRFLDFLFIRDENFTMQPDWDIRLKLIHNIFPMTKLYLFASANTLNEAKIKFMKSQNVYMLCLGLEDPTKQYKKNESLDSVVALLKKYKIMTYLSFIVNPLEIIGASAGKNYYKILMNRIEDLKPEMICGNFLMPFPGTKLWDTYYTYVDIEDYKYYDSKTPFLIRNKTVREKMRFFMFFYQWQYYMSDFYNTKIRKFNIGDTLNRRFIELKKEFDQLYEVYWDKRA